MTKVKIFVPLYVGMSTPPGACEYTCLCGKQWKVVFLSLLDMKANSRPRECFVHVYTG